MRLISSEFLRPAVDYGVVKRSCNLQLRLPSLLNFDLDVIVNEIHEYHSKEKRRIECSVNAPLKWQNDSRLVISLHLDDLLIQIPFKDIQGIRWTRDLLGFESGRLVIDSVCKKRVWTIQFVKQGSFLSLERLIYVELN